ncbi:MAG TPA: YdeI/OmpD-associated family protein [Parafilimonas sp.]|nr:YdeI/OmpD-associated family protein [Parafilimonas sp.]
MSEQNAPVTKTFASAKAWQTWLDKNYNTSTGIWLLLAKKNADKPTVTYLEALEAALCYGWIDGQKQGHDEQYWLQKFGPRKTGSIWSKKNIEHTEQLIKEGKMKPPGLQAIDAAKANGTWERAYDAQSTMTIPGDFLKALRRNKKAHTFFKTLNRTNLFSIAFRLQTAKKEETKQKRIRKIIEMLEREDKFH